MDTIREKDFRDGWAKWMQKVREIQINELAKAAIVCPHCNAIVMPNKGCSGIHKEQGVTCGAIK